VRRLLLDENAGHAAKEFLADQLLHHRITVGQRVDQRALHVVAIHRKPAGRIGTVGTEQASGAGQASVEQGGAEVGLSVHG
jgi:hypothetical protein